MDKMTDTAKGQKSKVLIYVIMFANFVVYSFLLAMANWAGQFELFSFSAIWRYGVAVGLMGVYAIVWQQVLKHIPLTIAYTCRAITILFGILWGTLLFAEVLTVQMGIGVALVIVGVVLVALK